MTTIPYNPTEITALQAQMQTVGEKLTSTSAWEVLRKVGDLDLAVTALLMSPRPVWLSELLAKKK